MVEIGRVRTTARPGGVRPKDSLHSIAALSKYPKFAKLYMVQGQILQAAKGYSGARAAYVAGFKAGPKDIMLWVLASRLGEADGKSIRARALIEKAWLVNPKNDVLWAEVVGIEDRSGASAQAKVLLARALQECPGSGVLWSLAIWAEARPQRGRAEEVRRRSARNLHRRAALLGPNARSKRCASGSTAPSLWAPISVMRGRGGSSSSDSMALRPWWRTSRHAVSPRNRTMARRGRRLRRMMRIAVGRRGSFLSSLRPHCNKPCSWGLCVRSFLWRSVAMTDSTTKTAVMDQGR